MHMFLPMRYQFYELLGSDLKTVITNQYCLEDCV